MVKKIIVTRNMEPPQHSSQEDSSEEDILRKMPEDFRHVLGKQLYEKDNRNVAITSKYEANRFRNLEIKDRICVKELDISSMTIQSDNLRTNPIFRNQNFNPGLNQNVGGNSDLMKAYVRAILLAAMDPIQPPRRLTFAMNHVNFLALTQHFSEALICVLKNIERVTILPYNNQLTMHMNDIVWIIRIINENIHDTTLDVLGLGTQIGGAQGVENPSVDSFDFSCKINVLCHPHSIFQQWKNIPQP